jgi:hypothetical protein
MSSALAINLKGVSASIRCNASLREAFFNCRDNLVFSRTWAWQTGAGRQAAAVRMIINIGKDRKGRWALRNIVMI